jgi:phosphatidylglycerol:prolipoprotein diacylglycerol transferase
MYPILFRIPMPGWELPLVGKLDSVPIYSYGVMLGLSLVVGWYLTLGLAEKDGLPREKMANNYVITAIAAVIMSRVLYVVTNLDEFETFADVFSMRRGGLVAYGGFVGGFLGSLAYLRSRKLPLLPWADVAVPSIAAGTAITRIGCYLFGCDYGQPLSEGAPGWLKSLGKFPHWPDGTLPTGAGSPAWVEHVKVRGLDPNAEYSLPVHPTQLYESLIGVGLVVLLLWARKRQRFRGQIFFLWTFAYGGLRFMLEIWRDDPERGNIPPALHEHVLLPLCLLLFAAAWIVGVSRIIENEALRRVSQVLSVVPAVAAYLMLRPQSFADSPLMQLSTSQAIGMASALAVGIGYLVLDKAALEHPETAMELDLPPEEVEPNDGPAGKSSVDDGGEDDDDAQRDEKPAEGGKKARTRKKKGRKGKKANKTAPEPAADELEPVADEPAPDEAAEPEPAADKPDEEPDDDA